MIGIENINDYKENNRLEAKKAADGLPLSIWETYSAFANTMGGVILLGVEELEDKSLNVVGTNNPEKLLSDFWNTINNPQKISLNLLQDKHVTIHDVDGKQVIMIEVHRANKGDKPIYINDNVFRSFRRNGEGDYLCSKESVKSMFRDASRETQDMQVLQDVPFSVFNYDTIKGYRNVMRHTRPGHVWEQLEDDEFLLKLGGVARGEDEKLHPTAAGVLMFGDEHEIVRVYPHYFLDYQEHFDSTVRWTDRVTSSSGEWSGNLFDFFYKAYNKLVQNPGVRVPFKLDGALRVDDTPVHGALREALANCLINADYHCEGGVVIRNSPDRITFENPGGLRLEMAEIISGGLSAPRNEVLMKMFNLIDIGERAGSGIPSIYQIWSKLEWGAPQFNERLDDIERTELVLPIEKQPIKTADKKQPIKTADKKENAKTRQQKDVICKIAETKGNIKSADLTEVLNIGETRVRTLLRELTKDGLLIDEGGNRNRTYRLNI